MRWHSVVRLYIIGCFLGFVSLGVWSASHDSVTVDEFTIVPSGYIKLTHPGEANWLNPVNPPLVQMLVALPWLAEDPEVDPAWWGRPQAELRWQVGYQFMAANLTSYDDLFFKSRLISIGLGCLLLWYAWKWSTVLFGFHGGLLTLTLASWSPTILAHTHLATTDVGATAFLLMAAYYAWRLLHGPESSSWKGAAAFCISLSLAIGAKYSALFCVPVFVVLGLRRGLANRSLAMTKWLMQVSVLAILTALVMVGALYAFEDLGVPLRVVDLTSSTLRAIGDSWLGQLPNPLPLMYLKGLDVEATRVASSQNVFFFLGEVTRTSSPYYFLIALLIKEPLPHLAAVVGGLVVLLRAHRIRGRVDSLWFVLLPGLWVFAVFSLGVGSNLGIRYVLFPVGCLYVSAGALGQWIANRKTARRLLALGCAISALSVLSRAPHFISYFNEAVGGPDGGRRLLSDSNVDWGQDLKSLKAFMQARGYQYVFLSYFGPVSPNVYGIRGEALATRGERSGLVAISVHHLNGIDPFDQNSVALVEPYRYRTPVGRAGYSILLFEER